MKYSSKQAIVACALLAGFVSVPAFAQNQGVIARGDCPKYARVAGHSPAPMAHQAMPTTPNAATQLERYVAELQAQPIAAAPTARSKRAKSLPLPF